MNKLLLNTLALFTTLLLFSCGGGGGGEVVPPTQKIFEQKYFFAVYYYNDGFRTYNGISIDNSGEVNSYKLDSWPDNFDNDSFTELELDTIFNDRKVLLQVIDQTSLMEKSILIEEASNGVLSEPINICVDAGSFGYVGYRFEPTTGLYNQTVLYKTGSWQSVNENAAAAEIRDWLIEIALQSQLASDFSNCTGIYEG